MEYNFKINLESIFKSVFEDKINENNFMEKIINQNTQINHFVERILKHKIISCHDNLDILVLYSLIYFMCLHKYQSFQIEMIYPFFIVCFSIANKFLCDENFNNKTFSIFSGIELSQFNQIEKFILKKIQYKLFIDFQKIQHFLIPKS
jgi:hypothetical protein